MNIHYFQHVPFEGLACMEDWVRRPSNKVTATRFYEDARLPFIELFDTLIVLGGPMSVHDEKEYPWIAQEKDLIKRAIERGKRVIGICLGAQLIAEVLGATVSKNTFREIGWMPITKTTEGKDHALLSDLPDTIHVFHWHGETFNLPNGATRLFSSEACENQAFSYGHNVLALQFHLEMTSEAIKTISEFCQDDLVEGPYIHKEETFYNDDNTLKANQWMYQLLNKFTKDSE